MLLHVFGVCLSIEFGTSAGRSAFIPSDSHFEHVSVHICSAASMTTLLCREWHDPSV